MRAVVVRELIGPDGAVYGDAPEPEGSHPLSPGERMLVKVHAAAICFPDLLQTRGRYQHLVPVACTACIASGNDWHSNATPVAAIRSPAFCAWRSLRAPIGLPVTGSIERA